MNKTKLIILPVVIFFQFHFAFIPVVSAEKVETGSVSTGRKVYDYYCDQCHGYTGNAKTVAIAFLSPQPRDFTTSSPEQLSRESMLKTVRDGRLGTAMVGFTRVLENNEIEAVVDYVRDNLMSHNPLTVRYHTDANGWPDHNRFSDAFPFVTGVIPLHTPWEELDARQRAGKQLYVTACFTCHEDGQAKELPIWELRAVSFPRKHYSHRIENIDALSGASVHLLHEQPTSTVNLDDQGERGQQLYLQNCAFCHAPDGSARNWIGSFLEPRPRDFTANGIIEGMSYQYLQQAILEGVPGTTMPAWQQVLTLKQIEDITVYLKQAFGKDKRRHNIPLANGKRPVSSGHNTLTWQRHRNNSNSR
jgi:cytochrome c oxidase cbb3-type subunit 3